MADFNFAKTEGKILDFWKEKKIFEKSLEARRKAKRFVFWEGPPTANGHPHMGHFEGRVFKDLFCRYKTMRGFFVLRKAGWDTHGLPVEIEVEKELGFKNKKDIEEYGIEKFNRKCRESVWKYKAEWEEMTQKMGFWLDLDNPYVTYETKYMESVWQILKMIWDKKLLYPAHKIVPFCARCGTPLSAHEVAQGYKTITEKSVIVKFQIKSEKFKNTYILAWTTTPWTLPGNVALAVGKDIDYAIVEHGGENYILAKDLIEKVFGQNSKFKIQNSLKGSDLIGIEYESLFEVPALKSDKSYRVYDADFVSTEDGTGVVHTAVMYGEDDYNLGTKLDLPKVHTVDETGKFNSFAGKELDGLYVKNNATEEKIIKNLEERGLLFKTEAYEHDYPFCWRCDTPLIYYAKNSWFIKTSAVNAELLKNNFKVNWVPEHIREGRFGQWLKEGRDWAISRERYWATPLPIWKCEKCDNKTVIGSIKDLEKKSLGSKNTYYILRHGLTERQEETKMIISSRLESDKYHLVSKGREDVDNIAMALHKAGGVDEIYASPFLRTTESAEIIGKVLHKSVKKDDRLGEFVHGSACEGKEHNVCPQRSEKEKFENREDSGESRNDVRRRMADFINEIESRHQNKKILIVGHGDPLWLLDAIAQGRTEKEIIENKESSEYWYPKLAELKKLNWRKIPRNELGELDLHRPFIDSVILKCSDCGAKMKKIPDLIDVWFDSGAMPYAQWHWPFENKKLFKEQFPADFIVEGVDQTRGWFYTLLAISSLLGNGAPYKTVMSLGHVLDEKGQKLSKSKGNYISPRDLMDKYGVDAARWYFYTVNAPGDPKLFAEKDLQAQLTGFLSTLQNCLKFYELYAESAGQSPIANRQSPVLDKWLLSKLNGLILEVSEKLDQYDVTTVARAIEKFVAEDFSNWWLRRSRKRKESLPLLRSALLEIAKLCAPFIPFTAEEMHMRLHAGSVAGTESIHLHDWPKAIKKLINLKLEEEMSEVRDIVTAGLAVRKEKQVKVRQPLRAVKINRAKKFDAGLEDLIKEELNVKKVLYDITQKETVRQLAELDLELDQALRAEGYTREMMRQIQDMRKEAKYKLNQKVFVQWHSDDKELSDAINEWSENIKRETLLREFLNSPSDKKDYDIQKETDLAPGKKIWVGVKK
ncbi:MAG: Isoleucine-tRNA ligase [Candidatus Yanofskybacteria bacterium GW2011_GWC2_41_9]|uniref:Isoleucine--tRNA ligase n=4 Tax=Parcubacteria group TaxID=1794811 RepID=A0A0G0XP42_9BACT|nr:MAG: Isoleucine-tRNA ligase [Candidatus Yanofskybacteria bacterium GW2011_GWC2_41_9]